MKVYLIIYTYYEVITLLNINDNNNKVIGIDDDNIDSLTIIARDIDGNIIHTIELTNTQQTWSIKNKDNVSTANIVLEYFNNCAEKDNNFDEQLIDYLCKFYNISKSILKAEIAFNRQSYISKA